MPNEVVFSLIAYMAAKKFGRAFTPEQFGYYIPAEHIDSPAGLTSTDDLLSGQPLVPGAPIVPGARERDAAYVTPQESAEPSSAVAGAPLFAVDQTGTIAYIRRTNMHVERRLELAARRGRTPEGMMHFGAALHAIEDLFAHSNWVEIAVNKILSEDPMLLEELKGQDRRVFTYSAQQKVAAGKTRDVLLTGSFTGADTKISVSSEAVSFLSSPLPPPASPAEALAEERFMKSMLHAYEGQLESNPAFRNQLHGLLVSKGVPGWIADGILALPVTEMYDVTRFHFVPDFLKKYITIPLKEAEREMLSTHVMKPLGRKLQAEGLNATVADTSLMTFLEQQQKASAKSYASLSPAEVTALEKEAQLTKKDVRTVHAEAQAAAARHAAALQGTPERVIAGPSHSQIAKDHPDSPFFGIAFRVAATAVRRMREKMIKAWNELAGSAGSSPFDFTGADFPSGTTVPAEEAEAAEANHRLYHDTRPERAKREAASLARGNQIIAQGGDDKHGGAFVAYDIEAMRFDMQRQLNNAALGLRSIVDAPGAVANALTIIEGALHVIGAIDERTKRAQEFLRGAAAAGRAASTGPDAKALNNLAQQLGALADVVPVARTHALRWGIRNALVSIRDRVGAALIGKDLGSKPQQALAVATVALIEEQIADSTPAYTIRQREVLESGNYRAHTGPSGPLQTTTIDLGDPSRTIDIGWNLGDRGQALEALIAESRILLNHPLENPWWEVTVIDYIRRFPDQIRADIEARNTGYATLRRPGEPHGHSD